MIPLPFEIGEKQIVTIDGLAYGGEGIAHPKGMALFVPRSAPQEEWEVEITDVRRRYGRAKPLELKKASPLRIEPTCPHYAECGGCHYQHLSVETAAREKQRQLEETLKRMGPEIALDVQPIKLTPEPWHYRNRLTYHRDDKGNQGYITWTDHRVLDVEDCPLAKPELNEVWKEVRANLKDVPSSTIPFVMLRSTTLGEKAVILSLALEPGEEVRLAEIREHTEPLASLASIFVTFIKPGSKTAVGKELHCLHGTPVFNEKVGEVNFILRPDLFFQVHPSVAEELVKDVVDQALKAKGKKALDLYCGAGLFSLALAKEGIHTLGVEVQHEAIQSAEVSAGENGLNSLAQFRSGKADRIAERLSREGETFDLIVADPPRKGLQPGVLEVLPKFQANTIIYVSCSPPTLARDLKILEGLGYQAQLIQPYDLFPQTYHMETLVVLKKS